MRALKGLLFSLGFLAATSASAAVSSLSVQHQQSRGGSLLSQGTTIQAVDSSTQSLLFNVEQLPWGAAVTAQMNQASPDYSSYRVRSATGEERPLRAAADDPFEYSAQVTASRAWSTHSLSLSSFQTLSKSPFALTALGFNWSESWAASSRVWGVQTQVMNQKQPRSTYIDRDQRQRDRPEEVRGYQLSTYFDSILTDRSKNRIEVGTSRRVEERPMNLWVRNRFGYALHDRVFAKLEGRRAQELRQGLQNERGYFELWHAVAGITVEPWYDILITPSYGILLERENDPRVETLTQTGTDQYGLTVEVALKDTRISSTLVRELSNSRANATLLTAGVTWTL